MKHSLIILMAAALAAAPGLAAPRNITLAAVVTAADTKAGTFTVERKAGRPQGPYTVKSSKKTVWSGLKRKPLPKKGDSVLIRGTLDGNTLQAATIHITDPDLKPGTATSGASAGR